MEEEREEKELPTAPAQRRVKPADVTQTGRRTTAKYNVVSKG